MATRKTVHYLSKLQFAQRIGASDPTLSGYKLPPPDVTIGPVKEDGSLERGSVGGWTEETIDEWRRTGRSRRADRSEGPCAMKNAFVRIGAFLVLAFLLTYWKIIVGVGLLALVVYGAYLGASAWSHRRRDRLNGKRARRSVLAARADAQHQAVPVRRRPRPVRRLQAGAAGLNGRSPRLQCPSWLEGSEPHGGPGNPGASVVSGVRLVGETYRRYVCVRDPRTPPPPVRGSRIFRGGCLARSVEPAAQLIRTRWPRSMSALRIVAADPSPHAAASVQPRAKWAAPRAKGGAVPSVSSSDFVSVDARRAGCSVEAVA